MFYNDKCLFVPISFLKGRIGMKKNLRKSLSVLLSILMAFSVMTVGLNVTASAAGASAPLIGRYFSTTDPWYDAVTDNSSGLGWVVGGFPSYNAETGFTSMQDYLKINNTSLFSGVSASTGITVAFKYTPNAGGNYRHLLSFGANDASTIAKHLYISANPSHVGGGTKVPVIGYVDAGGDQHINAYPSDGPAFEVGATYDVMISISATQIVYLINGVLCTTACDADSATYLTQFLNEVSTYQNNFIGRSRWNDSNFDGSVKDLRIYGAALLDKESLIAYNAAQFDAEYGSVNLSLNLTQSNAVNRFNAVAYHTENEAVGAYSNLVYAPYDQTNFTGGDDYDGYKEIGAIYFKIITPSSIVMVYDGVHDVYSPIEVETLKHDKAAVSNQALRYVESKSAILPLAQYWYGYQDGGGNNYKLWAGPMTGNWFSHVSEDAWDVGQDNTGTPRFWWNKVVYNGSGNTTSYFEVVRNLEFNVSSPFDNWGYKDGYGDLASESNYYVLNYKPVYDALPYALSCYTELSANAWKYTDESVARAKATIYQMLAANPNNTDYTYGTDASAAVASCGVNLTRAALLLGAFNSNTYGYEGLQLVKKVGTIRFEDYDGRLIASAPYEYGDLPNCTAPDDKPADDTYHYSFSNWSPAIEEVSGDRTYTAVYSGEAHHSTTAATCNAKAVCDECGATFGDYADHAYGTLTPAQAAGCTEAGNIAYYHCAVCGKYFDADKNEVEDIVIAANGHALTEHAAKSATCTEEGNIAYWECGVCHKFFTDAAGENEISAENIVVAKIAHALTGHAANDATCTEDGNIAYWECGDCHKIFSDAAGANEIAAADTVIPASGHGTVAEGTAEIRDAAEAGCLTGGYTGDTWCLKCNTKIAEGEAIEPRGHAYDSFEITYAATCSATGLKTYTCSRCGDTSKTEEIPIDGNAHAWSWRDDGDTHAHICANNPEHNETGLAHTMEVYERQNATTSAAGYEKSRCSDCGHEEEKVLPVLEREYGPWVDDGNGSTHTRTATDGSGETQTQDHILVDDPEHSTPSTCGSDKITAKICQDCGAILYTTYPGTATGNHSWGNPKSTTPGTCITPAAEFYECSVCHQTKTEYGEKDMTNHVGEQVVRNAQTADCNNEGYSGDTYCSACDTLLFIGTTSPKTGHSWEMTGHTSDNPCVRAGTNTYTCRNCGEVRTLFEPAKGHNFSAWKIVEEATCDAKGVESRTCSACGTVETRDIPALGHTDADGDGICDRCDTEYTDPSAPTYVFRCTHCDTYESHKNIPVVGIFYAFIHFFIHYGQMIGILSMNY